MALPSSKRPPAELDDEECGSDVKINSNRQATISTTTTLVCASDFKPQTTTDLSLVNGNGHKSEQSEETSSITSSSESDESGEISIHTYEMYMDLLSAWYEKLSPKQMQKLTSLELKRAAILICSRLDIDYDFLPEDWLEIFLEKYSLDLEQLNENGKQRGNDMPISPMSESSGSGSERGFRKIANKRSKESPVRPLSAKEKALRDESRLIKKLKCQVDISSSDESGSESADSYSSSSSVGEDDASSEGNKPAQGRKKKFIDLTKNHEPPRTWLEAYARGIILPRTVSLYSAEDANILYYDYSPCLVDATTGEKVDLKPKKRTEPGDFFPK